MSIKTKYPAAKRKKKKDEADDSPLYPEMASRMRVDFLFSEDGGVWLLHDKPLPDTLEWVEYDGDLETVTLVTDAGRMQDMGLKVPADFGYHLMHAMELTALLVQKGQFTDHATVPIIARHTALN